MGFAALNPSYERVGDHRIGCCALASLLLLDSDRLPSGLPEHAVGVLGGRKAAALLDERQIAKRVPISDPRPLELAARRARLVVFAARPVRASFHPLLVAGVQ